ncbi:adipokinetic hormone/corazonin-related peptide receptor variant I [Halyomorpha halys]|uniref:adipokinetic hormone/corazonin-related peptide receptor variant I n=1 Tax=Halyomorpha halys TaxID=286706 RepID=UPI0006D4FB0D|nr:gonadotropin-releasing hormone II receptor [Halyomorpha halys]
MQNGPTYRRVWFPDWPVHVTEDNKTFLIPIDMRFNEGHKVSLVFYSILMIISAVGNISVLAILLKRMKHSRSRINMMLIHLAIADLLVTFILMPMEIVWAATVSWWFGDIACRAAAFFRTFGLYQSCFVLVSIGIDRYYAVLKPLKLSAANRRGKFILICAWMASALCSLPQTIIFHVERHPNVTSYEQCITINSFSSYAQEFAYSFFGMLSMYLLPLIFIIYFYGSIFVEICKRSKDHHVDSDKLRRNNLAFFGKAKTRTLKMTITIISAFFICWTPYYVMAFWYWVDKDSATKVDQRVQKALFLFACTNSSINPIVYGVFNIRKPKNVSRTTRGSNTCTTEIKLQQYGQKNSIQ